MTDEQSKMERMLAKVRALIAKAESTTFPEEAASYRAKAEQLMVQYRIDEEMAREGEPATNRSTPISRMVRLCHSSSKFQNAYYQMFAAIARHTDSRYHHQWQGATLYGVAFGYEADLQYAEMIWMEAYLAFNQTLEPAPIPGEEERLTAFRYRNAGRTRREVAVMLWGTAVERSVAAHQKVQRWYEEEAAARGITVVTGRGVSREVFIKVYAESFVGRLRQRLNWAREATNATRESAALVLANRAERVDEAFYEAFPFLRPSTAVAHVQQDRRTEAQKRRDEARWDREARERQRMYQSEAGRAGWTAGTAAAEQVDIKSVAQARRVES